MDISLKTNNHYMFGWSYEYKKSHMYFRWIYPIITEYEDPTTEIIGTD